MIDVRPMSLQDVDAVAAVVHAADDDAARREGRPPEPRAEAQQAEFRRGMVRFVQRDPHGAFVAVDGGRVVGMSEAIRRGPFWGLSMLFVSPEHQGRGLGRRLSDAAAQSAEGAAVRMIMASADLRALRRYSALGLAVHPALQAEGHVDRSTVPSNLPGRSGDTNDLDLVAEVDAQLRGSRAEDVAFLLDGGAYLEVVDEGPRRGFAVLRGDRLAMLGATDDLTAAHLLWRALAATTGKAWIGCLTAGQDWAVRVALAARLVVKPTGPLFVSGRPLPPGPWVPSGWYF